MTPGVGLVTEPIAPAAATAAAARVLVIGLGGGGLARFIHDKYPQVSMGDVLVAGGRARLGCCAVQCAFVQCFCLLCFYATETRRLFVFQTLIQS